MKGSGRMRYRKKPVEVEAVQWTGKNLEEIKDFVGESLIYDIIDTAWKVEKGRPYVLMKIKTLEGDMIASEGDYIIKGISGEFYPCKPDIFKAIYEEVKELLGQTDKITIKIINKATQEIITEFNGDEYEILMEQEKVTEVSTNPKSCDNCGYGIIKANGSVQCYNSYTDFFSKQSHSPCAFWDKNKELAIKTVIEMRLCKNCKHLLIYNNDLCECECTNRTTVPLHSCQLWEGAI